MTDVVGDVMPLVEPQVRAKGLAFDVRLPEAPCVVWADREKLGQVLVNLLSNAVKFTERGGLITVSAGTAAEPAPDARVTGAGPWTCVRVEDTGGGIAPDRLEAVFEPFVQADMRHTRRHGGTGLGLTISRRLARLMGGDLTARSTPGLGSTFTLWLPTAPAGALVAGARAAGTDERSGARFARDGEGPGGAVPAGGASAGAASGGASPSGTPLGTLRDVSDAVTAELEPILDAYVARLRRDPDTPSAHALEREALENHLTTFLADVAQTLVAPALAAEARAAAADRAAEALRAFVDRAEATSVASFRASAGRRPAEDGPAVDAPAAE